MAELNLGTSAVETYQGNSHKGMMLNHRYVDKIYLGKTLIWEDPDAPTVSEITTNKVVWVAEDLFPGNYSFKSSHGENSPWPASGGTSDEYWIDYCIKLICEYSDGTKHYFWEDKDTASHNFQGTLYLNDVALDSYVSIGSTYSKYTIPENTKPYGLQYTICKKSLSGDNGKKSFIDYQTSDPHALFGLESDSKLSIDYASARNYLTRTSGIYTVSQPGTLVFRPLQECQLTFINPVGYYYVSSGSDIYSIHGDLTGTYSISSLPTKEEDIEKDPYLEAGFKYLNSKLTLTPGKIYLVGFCGETSFRFGDVFDTTVNSTEIPAGGGGIYLTIKTSSSTSWTVSSNSNWVTVNPPSGSGNSTIMLSAAKNTTGSQRSTTISIYNATTGLFENSFIVTQNPSADEGLNFDSAVPNGWHLTENSDGSWNFEEDGAMSTSSRTLTNLAFTPSKSGTVTLTGGAYIQTCDETIVGAALSSTNSYFNTGNSIPLCAYGEESVSLKVTAGNTYFVQALRDDATTGESYMITLTITFSSN